MEPTKTDSQKIDEIHKKIIRLQVFQGIVAAIAILGFFGIVTIYDATKKIKN